MSENHFKSKKPDFNKIESFGFVKKKDVYEYYTDIAENRFLMLVTVDLSGEVNTKVIDKENGEEYILHRVSDACGSFVGMVKAEYETVLTDISENCFEPDVFKGEQSKSIIDYVKNKYGNELEFLWKRFSDNAVCRRKDNKKWYCALLIISKRKLGIDSDDIVEIIDLRISPENLDSLIDNKKYFPGYHMNKKHWYTICLDNSVPTDEICRRIDESYVLALK